MRPDAHKKKASTQYKKKHGMTVDKRSDAHHAGDTRRREKAGSVEAVPGARASEPGAVSKTAAKPGQSPTPLEDALKAVRTFHRRGITSNWARYEEQEEDGDEQDKVAGQLRGADFQLLLSVATNAVSQFRFADEQDWDAEWSCDPASFMSIDCLDLAEALQCEPAHTRLGLTPATFSDAQLKKFMAAAEHHKQNYKRKAHAPVAMSDVVEFDQDLEQQLSEQESSDSDTEDAICHSGATLRVNVEPPGGTTDVTPCSPTEEPQRHGTTVPVPLVSVPEVAAVPEVPVVMGVPEVVPTMNSVGQTQDQGSTAPSADRSVDDLDFLLSLDEPVKTEMKDDVGEEEEEEEEMSSSLPVSVPAEPVPIATATPVQSSTTNLEDWLDDFLDD